MKKIILIVLVLIGSLAFASQEQTQEIKEDVVSLSDSIVVNASRTNLGISKFPTSKDRFSKILNLNGFTLIRKGTFIAQDIYSEGLKRGDVTVVVDGEQYHSACPNRMDSPLTRVNPLEMNVITFKKENSSFLTGLGGGLLINRIKPTDFSNLKASFTQSVAAESGSDFAFSALHPKYFVTGRYAFGYGYEDGDKNNFENLYNYSDDHKYQLAEFSVVHKANDFSYRGAFTYTDNIMFPYLRMDERLNRVFNGHASYKNQKIYFNYTDHMMDNQLRVSTMLMRTYVQNLTVGFVNDKFEFLFRNWDSDNIIKTPMSTIENHLIPNIYYYSGTYQNSFDKDAFAFAFSYKAGLKYVNMSDDDRLTMYTDLYPDAKQTRTLYSFGVKGDYLYELENNSAMKFTSELSSSEPSLEQLYISVKKPMGNPYWLGNPDLKQPTKMSLRSLFYKQNLSVSLFTHYISNYATLTKTMLGMQPYTTYKNIDALMYGFTMNYQTKYLSLSSGYTIAENKTDDVALSEIPPFYLITSVNSPQYKNLSLSFTHTYNDAQTRVDSLLTESKTTSWHRIDFSLNYFSTSYQVSLELDNLLDETYQQHMSYLRDPFSSGIAVNEPGRTIRLSVLYDYDL